MNKNLTIGFIGCGKMASAIIKGMISSKLFSTDKIKASTHTQDSAKTRERQLGISIFCNNRELTKQSDIVFLATKPSQVEGVLEEIKELTENKIIVSICAGVTIEKIEKYCPNSAIIRVMPNAPLMVGSGMSAIVRGEKASEKDIEIIKQIFDNLGKSIITTEDKIDIVTAISGSGPAFFYKVIHEIALAGEKLGMGYDEALLLAEQTALGSAKIMLEGELSPTELIENISTKGGCTEVGVSVMNELNTDKIFAEVIEKTAQKAKSLG